MIETLNHEYGIDGHVHFQTGKGGLPRAIIANRFSTAELYVYGAQLTAFQPHGAAPVLWMSDRAEFRYGRAIRGGVPLVWPWFGPHPTDAKKPRHGFARTMMWKTVGTSVLPDDSTQIRLQLTDSDATRALWPGAFQLEMHCTIGRQLRIELISRNTGTVPYIVGGALHTYFAAGNINLVKITGLEGRRYIDQDKENRKKVQQGPVTIAGEIDRLYFDTEDVCIIDDPVMERAIHIAKEGSRTTVVWNPWAEKAGRMSDFPDDGFQTMVCIETANAGDDVCELQPEEEHIMAQIISVRKGAGHV